MITLELKGSILKALRNADKVSRDLEALAIKEASTIVWGKAIQEAPVGASGALRKGIRRELSPVKATIHPSVPYALAVHEGTKPHPVAREAVAKGGSLYRWAVKRGLNPYAVAHSIAKKGTRANPFMKRTVEQTATDVQKTFERILGATVRKLAGLS